MAKKNTKSNIYNYKYASRMQGLTGYNGIVNKQRISFFLKHVNPQKTDRILEIGCNDGLFMSFMSKNCKECIGIDINQEILEKVKGKNMMLMDATNMNFKNNYFDKIYSSHVVEHVPGVKKFFQEAYRVLKPNGIFAVMFPWELFRGMRTIKDSFGVGENVFVHARKLHLHRLTPRKVRKIIKDIPFKVIKSGVHSGSIFPDYFMVLKKMQ